MAAGEHREGVPSYLQHRCRWTSPHFGVRAPCLGSHTFDARAQGRASDATPHSSVPYTLMIN